MCGKITYVDSSAEDSASFELCCRISAIWYLPDVLLFELSFRGICVNIELQAPLFAYQQLYVSYNVLSDNGLHLHISCYTGTVVKLLICCSQRVFERSSYKHFLNISIWQRWPVRKQVSQILKWRTICFGFAELSQIFCGFCGFADYVFFAVCGFAIWGLTKKFACPPFCYMALFNSANGSRRAGGFWDGRVSQRIYINVTV